jgi:uncharacterized protein (DUF779 family)
VTVNGIEEAQKSLAGSSAGGSQGRAHDASANVTHSEVQAFVQQAESNKHTQVVIVSLPQNGSAFSMQQS